MDIKLLTVGQIGRFYYRGATPVQVEVVTVGLTGVEFKFLQTRVPCREGKYIYLSYSNAEEFFVTEEVFCTLDIVEGTHEVWSPITEKDVTLKKWTINYMGRENIAYENFVRSEKSDKVCVQFNYGFYANIKEAVTEIKEQAVKVGL